MIEPVNSSLTNETTVDTEPEVKIPPVETQTQPASGQQPLEKPAVQGFDAEWWKKDPRHGKIWGKDQKVIPVPVDGVKSWHEADKILETKYKPAYKQYEDLKNRIKSLGYDPEKVDDFFTEVKTFKDPNNPVTALGNFLLQWKDDPLLDEIDGFFKNLNLKKLQRDFPGWTPEGIQKFQGLQAEVEAMRKEKEAQAKAQQEAHDKELIGQLQTEITAEIEKIKAECKELGFEFTDDVYNKLMDEGAKEKLSPKHLRFAFKELFSDDISKLSENKLKSKLMTDKDKLRRTTVPINRGSKQTSAKDDFEDSLRAALTAESKKT